MRQLTAEAQDERDCFEVYAMDHGTCTCFVSAPCDGCTHPGNPLNQEDDQFWEDVPEFTCDQVSAAVRNVLRPFVPVSDDPEEERLRRMLRPAIKSNECACGIARQACTYHKD